MRRLSRVLARFDSSGDCASIFPSVGTILERVRAAELNYPEQGAPWLRRLAWSRRTVFAYLKRLEKARISSTAGLSRYHGTKRRTLHPEGLLSAPRESCTPTRRESCTGSKSLESKKLQRGRKSQNHPADELARDNVPARRTPKPLSHSERLAKIAATARRNILSRTTESAESVDFILRTVIARATEAGKLIHSPAYLERGFDSQIADDAAQLERHLAELVAEAPEMRRKIALVHAWVEQAAREGRTAREVLAERFPRSS